MFKLIGELQKSVNTLQLFTSTPSSENDGPPGAESKVADVNSGGVAIEGVPSCEGTGAEQQYVKEFGLNLPLIKEKMFECAKVVTAATQDRVAKLSTIVHDHTPLAALERDNLEFKASLQRGEVDGDVASWIETNPTFRRHILALSLDRRNFVEPPPDGERNGGFQSADTLAGYLLKTDPKLAEMRYQLVPKVISEETFWQNYLYRLSLLKEALDKKESHRNPPTDTEVTPSGLQESFSQSSENNSEIETPTPGYTNAAEPITKQDTAVNSEDWEKELLNELGEFELVGPCSKNDEQWDEEIDELLRAEAENLKN